MPRRPTGVCWSGCAATRPDDPCWSLCSVHVVAGSVHVVRRIRSFPMLRSTSFARLVFRITALLQLVLPSIVSTADAQLERKALSARAFSHVEAKTGKHCAPVHSPDCALCQHVSSAFTKPGKPTLPVASVRPDTPNRERGVAAIAACERQPSLPRAPPVA